jgi:hypothetical protein
MFNSMCFDNWNTFTKVNCVGWNNIAFCIQCLSSLFKFPHQIWTLQVFITPCVTTTNLCAHM